MDEDIYVIKNEFVFSNEIFHRTIADCANERREVQFGLLTFNNNQTH